MMKKFRKILAMILVVCLCATLLPMQIVATGLTTEETTATSTTTDADGNLVVTVTVSKTTTGTDENGASVNGSETTTETTTTAPDGATTQTTVTDGAETKEWDEEIKPGQALPSIEVQLKPGQTTTGSATGSTTTTTDDETGTTTTTTTTNRDVSASLELEEKFEIIPDESKLECPVGPEEHDKGAYTTNDGTSITNRYFEGLANNGGKDYLEDKSFADGTPAVGEKPDEEGYEKGFDMVWSGYGDSTQGATAVFIVPNENGEIIYLKDENGNIVYENGLPVVDMEKNTFVNGKNGKAVGTGMVTSVGQFALKHENGEYFYAYCMDASTGASPDYNRWYNIRNLEDAIESEDNTDGYLSVEDAGMIRAIATTGYWGAESGRGSVESLKELLKATYGEDDTINVRYPGSNTAYSYDIFELIDGLTEAEALAVTQAAIWTFANNGDVSYDQGPFGGKVNNASVIGILSANKCYNGGTNGRKISWLNEYTPAKDGESDARMQALYACLLSLDPIYSDGELREDSTVIPNENVVSDVALVIHDKVDGAADNLDTNKDNDVYNAALNFKLAFVPGERDEMYVLLMDSNNQPILGADGQPIKKLLAAEGSDKSGDDVIKPVDGVYTLSGLKLSENVPFEFDLRLEGIQYLNEGVYIYQAEGGRRESQTLVGLAEGEQKIIVSNEMTITFEVDEGNHVVAERVWHNESDPTVTPGTPGGEEQPGGGNNPPVMTTLYNIDEEEVPLASHLSVNNELVEILDEEVPLAAVPETGDHSALLIIAIIATTLLLGATFIFDKKRAHQA